MTAALIVACVIAFLIPVATPQVREWVATRREQRALDAAREEETRAERDARDIAQLVADEEAPLRAEFEKLERAVQQREYRAERQRLRNAQRSGGSLTGMNVAVTIAEEAYRLAVQRDTERRKQQALTALNVPAGIKTTVTYRPSNHSYMIKNGGVQVEVPVETALARTDAILIQESFYHTGSPGHFTADRDDTSIFNKAAPPKPERVFPSLRSLISEALDRP